MSVSDMKARVDRLLVIRQQMESSVQRQRADAEAAATRAADAEAALAFCQRVAVETQAQLSYHVGAIGTEAFRAILPRPYELVVEFTPRRGRSEAVLRFRRDGQDTASPLDSAGGGAVDIAAFALRVSLWAMAGGSACRTIILDEPFRNLQKSLHPLAGQVMRELAARLKVQFIVATHEPGLAAEADHAVDLGEA